MKKYLFLISMFVLANKVQALGLGAAKIDSTLLEARMFKVIGDRSGALLDLPTSFPVIIMNQRSVDASGVETYTPIGFAVNCKGRDPGSVINAFGEAFLDTDDPIVMSEEDLNFAYKVSEQPILRCDALNGANQVSPLFSQVFRVIDRTAKKSYDLVRFNAFSPLDKKLFEVGCSNILDSFWKEGADRKITPIFVDSLKELPGSDSMGALHCFNTAAALPSNLTYGSFPEPDPVFDARVYRVEDPERGLLRVLLSGGKTFRLNCSATDTELQNAFGLPPTGKLQVITTVDEAFNDYVNGQMDAQPTLNCPSVSRPAFASDAYHVVNFSGLDARTAAKNPLLRLTAAEDSLVQFSCEPATNFFEKKLLGELAADPSKLQAITWESSDYLVRKYVPGALNAKRYVIGCAPGLLQAAEIKQLIRDVQGREPQSGELALHMNQCSSQGEVCTRPWMEQKIVDRASATAISSSRVILSAYAKTLSRLPQPEELNYFLKKTRRIHAKELGEFLKTAKFLDRALFISNMSYGAGSEFLGDALDRFTAQQFDNPAKVFTADIFKNEIEAYIKAQYLDEVIRRAYEINYWSGVQPFQITAMKAKITAKTVRALYTDMTNLLKNTPADCVTVASTKEEQTFTFFKPHWKVSSISGAWSADKTVHAQVGPVGYTGELAKAARLETKYSLGQLLIGTRDYAGTWLPWTGWTGSVAYDHYINEVKLVMNDLRGSFGDNSGSIKICFE